MGNKHARGNQHLRGATSEEASEDIQQIINHIKTFKSRKKYKSIIHEHVKSIEANSLEAEIVRAGQISKVPYAPAPTCIEYSIFHPDEAKKCKTREAVLDFYNSEYSKYWSMDRAFGCIYGMAIGDSWGHLVEFVPAQYDRVIIDALTNANFKAKGILNKFQLKPGQFTDDTSMGLCLADTLLVKGHVDCIDLKNVSLCGGI